MGSHARLEELERAFKRGGLPEQKGPPPLTGYCVECGGRGTTGRKYEKQTPCTACKGSGYGPRTSGKIFDD